MNLPRELVDRLMKASFVATRGDGEKCRVIVRGMVLAILDDYQITPKEDDEVPLCYEHWWQIADSTREWGGKL